MHIAFTRKGLLEILTALWLRTTAHYITLQSVLKDSEKPESNDMHVINDKTTLSMRQYWSFASQINLGPFRRAHLYT